MQVSRPEISVTEINENKNFIKLPIKPYLDLLGIAPIPSQIAIINAVQSLTYRFIVAAISRRQGKTFIANIIGQMVTLMPGSNVLVMAPNYNLSQISFDLQRQLINHFDLEVAKDNAKDRIIELENGSTIRMGSVNQVDSSVGRSYDLIIFDEAALADGEEAFNVALRPTLDKPNSKAIFISTPRGKNNWFARFWQRGFSDLYPAWCSIKATYQDNPRESIENITEARRTMSDAEFRQEYLADFNVFEGQIWRFDAAKCVADLQAFEITGKMDVIGGLDVGFRDPTAFCIIVYDWDSGKFYLVDEYLHAEKTTEGHAFQLRRLMEKWNPDFIFIDSANQQVRYDLAQNYDITTTNADKDVLSGIGFVGGIVENNNLIISSECKHAIAAMDQYQWDANPNLMKEKPKHNDACHMADAIRYAVYSFKTSNGIY
jgi:phage terminase large subunit